MVLFGQINVMVKLTLSSVYELNDINNIQFMQKKINKLHTKIENASLIAAYVTFFSKKYYIIKTKNVL